MCWFILIKFPCYSKRTDVFTVILTLNAPNAPKVVCLSHLLKFLRSLLWQKCGPRSDCSYRSSLFWVHAVSFYTYLVSNVWQLFAADDFSRRHFLRIFFLGALRVKKHIQLLFCPENVVCFFYVCCIYSSELQTRFFHGSEEFEPLSGYSPIAADCNIQATYERKQTRWAEDKTRDWHCKGYSQLIMVCHDRLI